MLWFQNPPDGFRAFSNEVSVSFMNFSTILVCIRITRMYKFFHITLGMTVPQLIIQTIYGVAAQEIDSLYILTLTVSVGSVVLSFFIYLSYSSISEGEQSSCMHRFYSWRHATSFSTDHYLIQIRVKNEGIRTRHQRPQYKSVSK